MRWFLLVGLAAMGWGMVGCGGPSICDYNGKLYRSGASYSSQDGCNTCSCQGGQTVCTNKACAASCKYQGKEYAHGTSLSEGCSVCTCQNGVMSCTHQHCQMCGGLLGTTCGSGEYCHYEGGHCGATDQTGRCRSRPGACNEQYDPVCGCDGKTYGNACAAATAGVSVQRKGVCKWKACLYNGREYKEGETFTAADGCNTCTCKDGQAQCSHTKCMPKTCAYQGKVYDPGDSFPAGDGCNQCRCDEGGHVTCTTAVCGCYYRGKMHKEGSTFSAGDDCNTCTCTKGVAVCTRRTCDQPCGSRGLKDCPAGDYCDQPTHCGASDAPGVCRKKPDDCPQHIDFVCGCNNVTYANACHANAAGASVRHKGKCKTEPSSCVYHGKVYPNGEEFPAADGCNKCVCDHGQARCTERGCKPPPEQPCGSHGTKACPTDWFCNQPTHCGATDIPGVCKKKTSACNFILAPVCGCDGKTYHNECMAHAAGVSVKRKGRCAP